MRFLIDAVGRKGTGTYKQAASALEAELKIAKVFSIHPGPVAGQLMNELWAMDPSLPPINVLLVDSSKGVPGVGADWYLGEWGEANYGRLGAPRRQQLLAEAMQAVLSYPNWTHAFERLFGRAYTPLLTGANRVTPGEHGGVAESPEHKALKLAVAANPAAVVSGLSSTLNIHTEYGLPSGDEIDVHVLDKRDSREYAIEVKSVKSSDADLERGIFQAVKYRAVLEARYRSVGGRGNIATVLVAERPLPRHLANYAKRLSVAVKIVAINRQGSSVV